MSDALRPCGLQHIRLPCPSLSPRICSESVSQWCYLTISSSVSPFSSCPQSFPASGSFPMRWAFASGGQSIGTLVLVLLMNILGCFPLGWTGLISFQSQGTLKSLLRHHSSKASFYINYLYKVSISNFSNILEIKILKYEWRGTILSMRLLRFVLQIYVFLMCRMLSPYHNSYQSLIPLQNQPWFQNLISVSCKSSAD